MGENIHKGGRDESFLHVEAKSKSSAKFIWQLVVTLNLNVVDVIIQFA